MNIYIYKEEHSLLPHEYGCAGAETRDSLRLSIIDHQLMLMTVDLEGKKRTYNSCKRQVAGLHVDMLAPYMLYPTPHTQNCEYNLVVIRVPIRIPTRSNNHPVV